MIVLDNLDLSDIEIMRVLRGAPSEGYAAEGVKSCGDNLVSAENVAKKLQKLADLKLVVAVSDSRYRLHIDGENFFWGRGELWSKILHVLYIQSLPLEVVQKILGEPEWKFNSALEVLRPRGYLHRNDMRTLGGKEVHLWELTPEGKRYVIEEFSKSEQKVEKTDLRELILKTEEDLRDLVSSILTREYGTRWENDPEIGWSKKRKEELEHRLSDKKKEFPTKSVSNRLIDYCYILNLKEIINKNEKIFKPIFHDWDKMMVYFDELGKYRDQIMHNTDPLSQSEINLCIGICGEFNKIVQHWKNGFSRKILSFSCDLKFDELERGKEEEEKTKALQSAQQLVDKIKSMSTGEIKTEFIEGRGDAYIIKLKEGVVKITMPTIRRHFDKEGYSQSGCIFVTTESYDAFDKVLTVGGHTYWNVEWIISDELDVHSLISRVEELHGRTPSSKSGTGQGTSAHWDSASYYILSNDGMRIHVDVSCSNSKSAKIGLVHDDSGFNKGFVNAHKIFSPDLILSILYGETQIPKIRELVNSSL